MQKIDITKQYRTRDGREVKLFTTEGRSKEPVAGEFIGEKGEWKPGSWDEFGRWWGASEYPVDLIEVVPRWSGKLWVHHGKAPIVEARIACCVSDLIREGFRLIDAQEVLPND